MHGLGVSLGSTGLQNVCVYRCKVLRNVMEKGSQGRIIQGTSKSTELFWTLHSGMGSHGRINMKGG